MAEWPIAAVLKTAVQQWTVGSNPTSSEPSGWQNATLFLLAISFEDHSCFLAMELIKFALAN